MTAPLPPKKDVALALLERSSVHVHLDPRAGGVVVPVGFRKQAQLVLQVGLNMAVPIPDLRVEDDGLSCTLSFNRTPFYCVIPWSAVFALVGDDGRGLVWPDDVPKELQRVAPPPASAAVKEAPKDEASKDKSVKKAPARKKKSAKSEEPAEASAPKAAPPPRGGKPVLVSLPRAEATPILSGKSKETPRETPRNTPKEPPSPAPAPPRAPQKSAGKPKRELPPYLRVVK